MISTVYAGHIHAADVSASISADTINAFMSVLDPIPFSGRYKLKKRINLGFLGSYTVTICDSAYSGSADGLVADINSSRIRVRGDVAFTWCGLNFGGAGPELTAVGNAYYSQPEKALRLLFPSAVVRPRFTLGGITFNLPVTIDVAPMLNAPAIPIRRSQVEFSTGEGRYIVPVQPTNVNVTLATGRIVVSSDLQLN